MNYRRGFHRLFVVLSLCWYIAAIPILWPKWSGATSAQRTAQDNLASVVAEESKLPPPPPGFRLDLSPDRFMAETALQEAKAKRPIILSAILMLIPALIYALAVAFLWVVSGFRKGGQV
jgi:hypothetical protein